MRDHAHTLSDFRVPTLSIECEPCGRRGRYNVAKLFEKYGDMKLPKLLYVLAAAARIYDRCPVRYGEDSRCSCDGRRLPRRPPRGCCARRSPTMLGLASPTVCRILADARKHDVAALS